MNWSVILSLELMFLVGYVLVSYIRTIKICRFSIASSNFRKIRSQAVTILMDELLGEGAGEKEENEVYNFISLTTEVIAHFEVLHPRFYKPTQIFHTLEILTNYVTKIDALNLSISKKTQQLKVQFIGNLYLVLKTFPFYQYRLLFKSSGLLEQSQF